MDESAQPVGKPNPFPSIKDDGGENDGTWNAPAAKGWTRSELGGGSQADPWSTPGGSGGKPKGQGTKREEARGSNPAGQGAPPKSAVKPAWGNAGAAKDWSRSELGMDDSVSQRGGGFRTGPTLEPGKKSWADQVEDEMDCASGDEPSPMILPAPELEGDGDGSDEGWMESGKGKGKGKGKARSATGWSDVTNQGIW